ncbi:hypothetical protein CONPUDRAFT_135091 [Coniophora puteana RWD-64-598 SS2]|uniref:WD40 repeat-like protein n=1 Tax=Coniophora puteana (strain RWD-64-598) TaxID=741705 RepID=A0A5M3N1W1_CONPW|nr:uncharacterized protein CONPUDRAFT_135091 [Coniophora puteana RWD-64-598 SS2]EIW85296.1 hypothetical protein CONPUDRAFT_135091 [Coniophora puteana RWD-64-598 SS2]
MDSRILRYNNGSIVHVVRPCHNGDGADLIAVGGEHSVDILQATPSTSVKRVASFHVGSRITALAWSPKSVSPSAGDEWSIEIVAAAVDYSLHLLTKSHDSAEHIFQFGGGLSGHHGRINDMCYCGGQSQENVRYVATVSDDKMLMIWDLYPAVDISSNILSASSREEPVSSPTPRAQPTAYVISFPHPLTSVSPHVSSSKEFLVSDCRGSIFITDWRSDPDQVDTFARRHGTVIELVEPAALSQALTGTLAQWAGSAGWKPTTPEIVGAAYGSSFSIWDLSNIRGGKPQFSATTFPEGGKHFRWSPQRPDVFAVSGQPSSQGAMIHVYNTAYLQAQPNAVQVAPAPHCIRDFHFMAVNDGLAMVAAVDQEVLIFALGTD